MKTATIGYPRVGTLRELKFATEKYFEGVLSKAELQDTAALLRKTHWQMHINNSLDFIPSNDSDLAIIDVLNQCGFKTAVGPGVYDIHSPRIPGIEEIKATLFKMLENIPKEKLWVNPDCGLKTRGNTETVPSLKNLVDAAQQVRRSLQL